MIGWVVVAGVGVAAIVWGAETFAENLAMAAARLGLSTSAFAVSAFLAAALASAGGPSTPGDRS